MNRQTPCISSIILAACFLVLIPCSRGIGKTGTEDPDKLLQKALERHQAGNFSGAKALCRQILNEYPHYVDARNLYARVISYEGNYAEALTQYDSALAYVSNNPDARFGKAQVLAWSDRFEQSVSILESLTEDFPMEVIFLTELAKVRSWARDYRNSYRDFQKAFLLDPKSVDVVRGAARVAVALRERKAATAWYERLASMIPHDPEAQFEITRLSLGANHEVQFQFSVETFGAPSSDSHTILGGEYLFEVKDGWKPYVHGSRIMKFGQTDIRAGVGLYALLSYGANLYSQILLSPSSDVIPRFDATAELSRSVLEGIEAIFGYRYMSFPSSRVFLLVPGATVYLSERSWVTSRAYVGNSSDGSISSAVVITTFYRINPSVMTRAAVSFGDEAFRATTMNEIVGVHSSGFLAAAKVRFTETVGLECLYQFTARSSESSSHLLTASISFYF